MGMLTTKCSFEFYCIHKLGNRCMTEQKCKYKEELEMESNDMTFECTLPECNVQYVRDGDCNHYFNGMCEGTPCGRKQGKSNPSTCTSMQFPVEESDFEFKYKTGLDNFNKYNTGIKAKKKFFHIFVELIKKQFWHGGDKYRLTDYKEFTDIVCEAFGGECGVDFILATCLKYLGRYKNFGREKDIIKVATYMYILWLKGGYHLNELHDDDTNRDGSRTDVKTD